MQGVCGKIALSYRRHLEMQISDCVVSFVFLSTSTILNPMRPSLQRLIGKLVLGEKPFLLHILRLFCPESELFLQILCSSWYRLFLQSEDMQAFHREMAKPFIATFPNPFLTRFQGKFRRHTDTLMAPYIANYVHQILFFSYEVLLNLRLRTVPADPSLSGDRRGWSNNIYQCTVYRRRVVSQNAFARSQWLEFKLIDMSSLPMFRIYCYIHARSQWFVLQGDIVFKKTGFSEPPDQIHLHFLIF